MGNLGMHGEKSSIGLLRLGPPHTMWGMCKASIEKVGPEAKVLWTVLSSVMLIRGRACAWSLTSRSLILSSIKEKIKSSHWVVLKMKLVNTLGSCMSAIALIVFAW